MMVDMNLQHSPASFTKTSFRKVRSSLDDVSAFNRRGLFVGGCPKSGTTLLLTLLDSHPELVVFPRETHYFEDGRKYTACNDYKARLKYLIERADLKLVEQGRPETDREGIGQHSIFNCENFSRIALDFMGKPGMNDSMFLSESVRAYAVAMCHPWRDCVRWVEKTPGNVPYAEDVFRLFPDAKMVHILRDPRAVFASRRRRLINRYGSYTKAHRFVREWNESTRQIKKLQQRTGNYLLIRYEDLVCHSREVMEEVCRFIGIQFFHTLLEPTCAGREWRGNSTFHQQFNGIDSQPLDEWKKELSEADIRWIEWHCREGMSIAGYEPLTDEKFSLHRWARRLPGESWGGYLRARRGSLCQMAGLLKDCRYDVE